MAIKLRLTMSHVSADTNLPDPNASVQRPMDAHLSCDRLSKIGFDWKIRSFEESIEPC